MPCVVSNITGLDGYFSLYVDVADVYEPNVVKYVAPSLSATTYDIPVYGCSLRNTVCPFTSS